MYLAIDTATSLLGLALLDEARLIGEIAWRTKQNHSAELVPALRYLLGKAGTDIHGLRGIVVARGPGGFTGLRVGIATAKGLAFSTGVPLVGISSLEARAFPYAQTGLPICPLMDAGRGEVSAAVYRWQEGQVQVLVPEQVTSPEELCSRISEPTMFCGDVSETLESCLKEALREKALLPLSAVIAYRVAHLGELGRRRIQKEESDNPATLQPVYLRRPAITRPRRSS